MLEAALEIELIGNTGRHLWAFFLWLFWKQPPLAWRPKGFIKKRPHFGLEIINGFQYSQLKDRKIEKDLIQTSWNDILIHQN